MKQTIVHDRMHHIAQPHDALAILNHIQIGQRHATILAAFIGCMLLAYDFPTTARKRSDRSYLTLHVTPACFAALACESSYVYSGPNRG
jgi:hypothetical protein